MLPSELTTQLPTLDQGLGYRNTLDDVLKLFRTVDAGWDSRLPFNSGIREITVEMYMDMTVARGESIFGHATSLKMLEFSVRREEKLHYVFTRERPRARCPDPLQCTTAGRCDRRGSRAGGTPGGQQRRGAQDEPGPAAPQLEGGRGKRQTPGCSMVR